MLYFKRHFGGVSSVHFSTFSDEKQGTSNTISGYNHTQVAMRDVHWTFVNGRLYYVDAFWCQLETK